MPLSRYPNSVKIRFSVQVNNTMTVNCEGVWLEPSLTESLDSLTSIDRLNYGIYVNKQTVARNSQIGVFNWSVG
jgi:hypothetical protein